MTSTQASAPFRSTGFGSTATLRWRATSANVSVPQEQVAKHIRSPVLWGADVFANENRDNPLCMDFKSIMEESPSPSGSSQLENLRNVMKSHGVALVRGVPSDEVGTLDISLKLGGHVRSTFYGAGMWTIVAEEKSGDRVFHDKGYTTDGNLLHTDCTYFVDPPGYQLLTCDVQAAEGGVATFVDGFAVAERLRVEHPEAFEFFTTTPLRYKHIDDECHYVNEGPIFRLDEHGQVDQVRDNDYDRSPFDYLSSGDVDLFYEYHKHLIAIMRDPTMLARHLLEPGDCLVLNNQRGIHGREAFKGWRRMVGYFIGMDEVDSMARMHNV